MINPILSGTKLGIHAQLLDFFDDLVLAVEQGSPFPVVKLTQDFTQLKSVKELSPETITVARPVGLQDGMEGINDLQDSGVNDYANWILESLYIFAARNPEYMQYIDVWECVNEPDPPSEHGYLMMGKVFARAADVIAEDFPDLHLGIVSGNMGTPEYSEMQALASSGVFERDNIVLCLHEGVQNSTDAINKWHSSESDHPDAGLIPGAPSVPENGGALFGRVAYWHQILGDELMPPTIISEAYLHSYNNTDELRQKAAWVDDLYSKMWYVVGFLPFTHSPTARWENQDYTPHYPALIDYMVDVRNRENAPGPQPEINWRQEVWSKSIQEQEERGVTINPTFAFIKYFDDNDYSPVHREISHTTSDGQRRQLQAAESLSGEKPRIALTYEPPWEGMGKVEVLTEDSLEPEPDEPFSFEAWPTDHKDVSQTFGNNPDYYGRFGLPGHEGEDIVAPRGTNVYAAHDGIVSDLRHAGDDAHAYGRFIRVREGEYETTYAHLDSIDVALGQRVEAGQKIGAADNTGNIIRGSSHLHLTLKHFGNPAPGYPSDIADPTPFLFPHKPSFPGLPVPAHGLTLCDVSRHNNPKDSNNRVSGPINFTKMMRRGVYGAYIRGSIGRSGEDEAFELNWNAIGSVPAMKRGMYHLWISSGMRAEDNLANIARMVDRYGHGDMRIVIDVEPVSGGRINGNEIARFLPMFREEFGYDPLIYTALWVISYIDGDKNWLATSDLWLAAYWNNIPRVGQYPSLPIGSTRDSLFAHQWTSSYHDGRNWGVASLGLDFNVVYDLDRLLVDFNPPPPPQGVDMAQFFFPHFGNFGDLVILANNWGEGDERQQLQRDGNISYVTKNQLWEKRRIESDVIWFEVDTSPREGQYYVVESNTGWMPRTWRVGQSFSRTEIARFRFKGNCEPTGEVFSGTSDLFFAALHSRYTTRGGLTFENVAEVHWVRNGQVEERYFYAGHYGLVAWRNRHGRESWATEVIPVGQQHNNTREQIPCL